MKNPREHRVYRVEFWDHCKNDDVPMLCVVWGRLAKLEKDYLVLDCWGHMDPNHHRSHGDDVETFTILRSCIVALYEAEDWKKL